MRGIRVTQAGEQAVFQGIREVCAMSGVWGISAISVSLSAPPCCQRTLPGVDFHQQHRSSFRLEGLAPTT